MDVPAADTAPPVGENPKYDQYLRWLLAKNEVLNLTAAANLEELRTRHLEDCFHLLELPELEGLTTALDLGTGGGFPGIPLAISRPALKVYLMDGTRKKLTALDEAIATLELPNALTLWGRAEALGRDPQWRQRLDLVTARAFAPLPATLEYGVPFTRIGGLLAVFLGPSGEQDIQAAGPAAAQLGTRLERVIGYRLQDRPFFLALYRTRGRVTSLFPRSQDLPRKRPLGT